MDNNDESRVYFGPFKSPEKKYLAIPHPSTPSPLRRSPRLSSTLLAQPAPIRVEVSTVLAEEDADSLPGTPDNDGWQDDEPSSALATRIVRASDNPSPPPSDHGQERDSLYPIPFTISAPTSRGGSPSVPNPTQPDLISFDSFTVAMDPLPVQPTTSSDTRNPSVDELLLSWSPSARDIPPASVSPHPSDVDEHTPEAVEEQAVADALTLPEASVPPPSPPPDVPAVAPVPEDPPRTPLRRSTRPRRSGTPLPHLVPLPESEEDEPPPLPPPSTLKRKRKSEKERDVSNENGELQNEEEADAAMLADGDRKVKRRKDRRQTLESAQRHLGSLSPSSTNLLTHLLPPSRSSPLREQEEPPPSSFSVFPAVNPAPSTPVGTSSVIRVSPSRNARPRSPNKIQLQPPSLSDPNRTPARRIPMQLSPQKAVHLSADPASISRTPVFRVQPQESPARRVNVGPPSSSKTQGIRFGSPTRGKSRERSGSVEPKPPWNGSTTAGPSDLNALAARQRSLSPSRSLSAPIRNLKGKLPFPLTPASAHRLATIPHSPNDDPQGMPAPAPVPSTAGIIKVPRSNLKQPTSRIPRIGVKPYVRPAAAKPPSDNGTTVETARSSKMSKATGASDTGDKVAGPSNLKRKRVPSPQSKPRPVVVLRQVPPTKLAPPKPVVNVQVPPSPVKRPAPVKFRMVDLHARPPTASETKVSDVAPSIPPAAPPTPVPAPDPEVETPSSEIPTIQLSSDPVPQPPSSSPPDVVAEPETGSVRRTGRLRKSVFPESASAPPTRRKVSGQPAMAGGSGPFAGMTAVALKQLTSSNTTRNQKYLVAHLETQVVRKEGDRPESPGMKIKTIAQREKDERGVQRKARAARRAKRNEEGWSDGEGGDTSGVVDSDEEYDELESSPVRHRRGPGDEEDYETPKQGKRVRSGTTSSEDGQEDKKRVKWHRGLSTVVFLDDVEPRTKAKPKENSLIKGCLTPAAKALRLDPLGNHPHAESPLKDLVEENVVVKKFVYDNDDEPALPVVVVKNTRSKAKKKS